MSTEIKKEVALEIGHVLFVDIVGYSKLLINEQRALVDTLNQIVRDTGEFRSAEAAGRLIKVPTGDGMALVFYNSPEAPVECALEISRALKEHPELRLRMGVHSGPVSGVVDVNERANVAGAGINIAQRVMDCGDAGHILLSKRVAEDLEQYGHWQPHLHDLGECEVKHGVRVSVVNLYTEDLGNPAVPEKFKGASGATAKGQAGSDSAETKTRSKRAVPSWMLIGTVILIVAAIALSLVLKVGTHLRGVPQNAVEDHGRPGGASLPAPEKSIAVLPFVDLSQAKDQEYFCDGISEEILDALAKVEGLRVVARTSSFSFKGKNADVSEIAQKLNVQNVLEGSLRREGNRIRVTAQLINAHDGFHIWSDTFERDLQGVFAVQDEITGSIVDALKIKLAVAPKAPAEQNTEAYDLYLQGLYLSNKSDEGQLRKALTLFQRALEKDPTLSRAWTGIAKVWYWLADSYVKPLEGYPEVESAATKALELNERDAESHCYLGQVKRVLHWDLSGAERELKRALEIDPNSSNAHLTSALVHSNSGDLEKVAKEINEAERLDPLSTIVSNMQAAMYVNLGQLDDALAAARRTRTIDPDYVYIEPIEARIYREQGKLEEALAIYLKAAETTHEPVGGLAITYARLGRMDDARRVLQQLIDKANRSYVAGEQIASVFVALGDRDEAFRWLNRAVAEHSGNTIATRRELRPLYSDPRFAELLRRMGVDPAKVVDRQNTQ